MEEGWDTDGESEAAGNAGSVKASQEAESGSVKEVESYGGRLEGGCGIFEEDLDRAIEEVDTGGEGTVLNDVVEGGLHEGRFESRDGLFAESCARGVSKDCEA